MTTRRLQRATWVLPLLAAALMLGGRAPGQAQPGPQPSAEKPPAPPRYKVTVIQGQRHPTYGYPGVAAMGINNLGHIVGYFGFFGDDRAFVWTPEAGFQALSFPAGTTSSQAHDINDRGQIVGVFSNTQLGGRRGFVYDGQQVTVISPPPGGNFVEAQAVNNAGQVVGYWGNGVTGRPAAEAFVWQNGTMKTLGPDLDASPSSAQALSESGLITGKMSSPWTDTRAFLWSADAVLKLGMLPGGLGAWARGVNDFGHAVGDSTAGRSPTQSVLVRAVLWRGIQPTDLGTIGGRLHSRAYAINNCGQVVGYCHDDALTNALPFLWHEGTMWDLNLLMANDLGASIGLARAINEEGQIAAGGLVPTGAAAFLLTPLP